MNGSLKKMIGSIHYISVIFSNRESICIIPGLIKDLAPCKYYVSNPHILPPRCASGVYLSNNWYALLQRNSGWVFDNTTQVNVDGRNCGGPRVTNQFSEVPTSISAKNSLPRYPALSAPGSEEGCDLVNLDLTTVVAKVLPNLTLLGLSVGIGERAWAKQSPKFNN